MMNISFLSLLFSRPFIVCCACLLALGGCGGKSNGGAPLSYSLGGNVTGLNGSLVLQNNGANNLTISASGSFSFPTQTAPGSFYNQVANSGSYSVTISSQPVGQTCTLSNASGNVTSGSNISNVTVNCSTNYYSVGGTISGLTGSVVLQNNLGDNLTVSANGTFTFQTQLTVGNPYSVTIFTAPATGTCSVSSGAGTISNSSISSVVVTCATIGYSVGGSVSGMAAGTNLVLQDNNAEKLPVNVNGTFNFVNQVANTSPYMVSLFTRPAGQNCSITNGTGIIGGTVSNVLVACKNVLIAGCNQSGAVFLSNPVNVVAYAGSGTSGSANNTSLTLPTSATFNYPRGVTFDGTNLFIADSINNQIRMITLATGVVTTLAGSGAAGSADGTGASATFDNPNGITSDGTFLYVADTLNNKIRQIIIATGAVTTLAGSGSVGSADNTVGTAATFNNPAGITNDGSNLYVADTLNNKIRKIVMSTGAVTTLAGSGTVGATDNIGTSATFNNPWGITTDGNNLYVADTYNHKIRQIVITSGVVTTVAGFGSPGTTDGTGAAAYFDLPRGITKDNSYLYVTDTTNQLIRKVTLIGGSVVTLAGTATIAGSADGTGTSASFSDPSGITTDGTSLYIADTKNNKIRRMY